MKLHKTMSSFELNTIYTTEVYRNIYLLDPNTMNLICSKNKQNEREHIEYLYSVNDYNDLIVFIKDIASGFLHLKNHKHNENEWFMDIIRYDLDDCIKSIDSGLAWHCENDNYDNLITVFMYTRIDDGIIDGNLRYLDSQNVKQTIKIEPGTVIIMDGRVKHKPQNPSGSGIRDVIIVSFSINI